MGIDLAIGGIIDALATAAPAAAAEAAPAIAADVGVAGAEAAGAVALPEITVTAADAAAAGAGTEAALGGGAAAAGGLTAADVAAGTGAAAGGLGLIGAAEAGGTSPATIVGGEFSQLPGGAGGTGTGATPAPAAPTTVPGGGLPSSGSVQSPTEALSGATGPLAALSPALVTPSPGFGTPPESAPGGAGVFTTGTNADLSSAAATPQSFASTTAPTTPAISPAAETALGGGNALDASAVDQAAATPGYAGGTQAPPTSLAAPNAPATPAPATPGAEAGFGLNLKTAATLAPLGALGLTLARGQPSLPPAMESALNQLGPTENLANTFLSNAANNTITPAQTQEIATYKQNAINQLYQFYASQGRDPNKDSDYLQGVQQINQNAIAMQQQFIDAMVQQGLNAQGAVSSELTAAANLQMQSDQNFQASIAAALQSFGLVAAISSIKA